MSNHQDDDNIKRFYAWVLVVGLSILIWLWICGCPAIIRLLTK